MTRRELLSSGMAVLGGALIAPASRAALPATLGAAVPPPPAGELQTDGRYRPVITPNGASLPWRTVDGAKVYHLIAEEVEHEFAPGLTAKCWGYNGRVHGPTIEAVEGDTVRIYVTNRLPAPTTVHWHGVLLPNGMDGVGGLTQPIIHPGETFLYEFPVRQVGTFMYHSHHDEMTQMAMGLMGMMVFHPRNDRNPVDRDFALLASTWRIDVGTSRPNPNEMVDFNVLTFNARAFPGTDSMVVRTGDRVRIRLGNLSAMDHHPIHLHGFEWRMAGTDARQIPQNLQYPQGTVLVPVGSTRTMEFEADAPGDWAIHCHMTHHVMNQMGHDFPNMVGMEPGDLDRRVRSLLPGYMTMGERGMDDMGEHIEDGHMPIPENSIPMIGAYGPFDYITMGGMFSIVKVRDQLPGGYDTDPGWYEHPAGTVASRAAAAQLQRDGIRA